MASVADTCPPVCCVLGPSLCAGWAWQSSLVMGSWNDGVCGSVWLLGSDVKVGRLLPCGSWLERLAAELSLLSCCCGCTEDVCFRGDAAAVHTGESMLQERLFMSIKRLFRRDRRFCESVAVDAEQ